MTRKSKTGSMLSDLDKKKADENGSELDEKMVEALCNVTKTYTYSLPVIVDAILEVLKTERNKYKNTILTEIVMNSVDEETLQKAKDKVMAKSGM